MPRSPEEIDILLSALDRSPDERVAHVREACEGDADLEERILYLLALSNETSHFLESQTFELSAIDRIVKCDDSVSGGGDGDGSAQPLLSTASTPASVGPYRIVRAIGSGAMGAVYLAEEDDRIRRQVALKLMLPGVAGRNYVARFRAERQALALLSHPAIARVYAAGETAADQPWLAMEYVDGQPIDEYCDEHELGLRGRLQLVQRICRGLEHAHAQGIIHRDLKPSNILVTTVDGVPAPKIIDFGLAMAPDQALTAETFHTETGAILGTLPYMSPEQATPEGGAVNALTDVYSVGVVLYELLVGERPLDWSERVSPFEAIRRIREVDPPTPSTRWERLNAASQAELARNRSASPSAVSQRLKGDLDWITMRGIEKDRSRRYGSAVELSEDIERYLSDKPVVAKPPSGTYRLKKFVRRHRWPVSLAVSIVVLLLAGLAATGWFASQSSERLQRILRLADADLLAAYEAGARDHLWPAMPSKVAEMRRWIGDADELRSRLPLHQDSLRQLRSAATDENGALSFSSRELEWEYKLLSGLVTGLEEFFSEENRTQSSYHRVRERLRFAETIEQRSLRDAAERWERARQSIADRAECPAYDGFALAPQLGLVPLRRNAQSGLWEFWQVQSGAEPEWNAARGAWNLREETGIVLVLIPGGSFVRGAVAPLGGASFVEKELTIAAVAPGSSAARLGLLAGDRVVAINGQQIRKPGELEVTLSVLRSGDVLRATAERGSRRVTLETVLPPQSDPYAQDDEIELKPETVKPFFLSKFELTQAQWRRFTTRTRSTYGPGRELHGYVHTALHPVETVSWGDAHSETGKLALRLPTETEWEYAARAGTRTIWWTGDGATTLQSAANLADETYHERDPNRPYESGIRDGFLAHAPVGRYRPNAFGLHDVLGNVREWCEDHYQRDGKPLGRVMRGGGFGSIATVLRSADRGFSVAARNDLGLRPARSVSDDGR